MLSEPSFCITSTKGSSLVVVWKMGLQTSSSLSRATTLKLSLYVGRERSSFTSGIIIFAYPKNQIIDYPLSLWFANANFGHFGVCFPPQANSTMQVNSLQIPESDIMGTNGVIHLVNHILYPGGTFFLLCVIKNVISLQVQNLNQPPFFPDIPTGNQNLLKLLKKLITNIQIKVLQQILTIKRQKCIFCCLF